MNRRKGFTLVELLVVMAIIAILASIVVPNVAGYLRRGQATRALGEIQSIELALTKMVSDAGRSGVSDLFYRGSPVTNQQTNSIAKISVSDLLGITPGQMTAEQFRRAQKIYTDTIYALLRQGRAVLGLNEPVTYNNQTLVDAYRVILDENAVNKLGSQYLDIGTDPFGNLYNIYPGPWPSRNGPIPFRKYLSVTNTNIPGSGTGGTADALTGSITDPDTNAPLNVGFPGARDKIAFIWSNGLNLSSGQAIYSATSVAQNYPAPKTQHYPEQEPEFQFGGDDINNWDSERTWERFY